MNRMLFFLLVACLLTCMPAPVAASDDSMTSSFPGCGTVTNRNSSYQFGIFNWIEYIVESTGAVDICGQWVVHVEANVVGVANSGHAATGIMYASVRRQIPVPAYNRVYQTTGRHYVSGSFPNPINGPWWPAGNTSSSAMVVAPPPQPDPAFDCFLNDGIWRDTWCDMKPASPIIVDSLRNGYALTGVNRGVRFDLDADGVPEMVAWTDPDSDDEFLAMDRNGNGRIDDGTELFGDHTPAYPSGPAVTTANGFEALKFLQSPSYGVSRIDTVIDAGDVTFSRLMLWRDANHNGISEPDELRYLSQAGVIGISTEYKEKKRTDRHGNQFRQRGTIFWEDGSNFVFDVWLQSRD
jgi:hypothetical protein